MRHTLNLTPWLKALGIKVQDDPELVPSVQPVQVISDASGLVHPVLPPISWFGGYVTPVAGQYQGLQVHALAEGGCNIRYLAARPANQNWLTFNITASNIYAGYATAINEVRMGPSALVSTVKKGESPTQVNSSNYPMWYAANNAPRELPDLIYVPHGYWFTLQVDIVNVGLDFAMVVQDCPASEGPL